MGKDEKKKFNDRSKYENTQQTETYRQQLTKEKNVLQTKTMQDIEKLDPFFGTNNNYLAILKKDAETNNSTSVAFKHPLDQLGVIDQDFCQKCKKDVGFCPHKQKNDNIKFSQTTLKHPVVNSQTYGWREPIDDSNWGNGLQSTMQSFSSSFRSDKPKDTANKAELKYFYILLEGCPFFENKQISLKIIANSRKTTLGLNEVTL